MEVGWERIVHEIMVAAIMLPPKSKRAAGLESYWMWFVWLLCQYRMSTKIISLSFPHILVK